MDQLRGGMLSEGEREGEQHLHSLRQDFIEGHAMRKAAKASVLGDKAEVVGDGVGLDFRGKCVDEVKDGVDGEDWDKQGPGSPEPEASATEVPQAKDYATGTPQAKGCAAVT